MSEESCGATWNAFSTHVPEAVLMNQDDALPRPYPHLDQASWQRTTQNLVEGGWEHSAESLPILHKYSRQTLGTVSVANADQVERAVGAAQDVLASGLLPGH